MPGIVGFISQRPAQECQVLVQAMVSSMVHESFYRSGTFSVAELGFYCGWAVPGDAFASRQPFYNEARDIVLVFSGECFLEPGLGASLSQKGHTPGTDPAGWLVHLYEELGENFVGKLNGLFSGLLIDKRQKKAFLFNDRYGLERIYWHETNYGWYFASEAKALLRVLTDLREFDPKGVAQFLTFGCALDGRTLFRDIQLLPGASIWSFSDGKCHQRKYFSAESWESQRPLSATDFEAEFQTIFKRVLPQYLGGPSRIGISLTAGLDTRMIMACLSKCAQQPVCYTFSAQNEDTLDARLAGDVARACGLEHRILRIGPDFFSNFENHVNRTVYITDGCFGVLGAHEIYLNAQGRALAPIRLTGNYGSEVLRGVSTFKPLGLSSRLYHPEMSPVVNSCIREFAEDQAHPVTFAAFREIPSTLFGSLVAGRSQVNFRSPYLDNELVALAYRAPDHLRTSSMIPLRLIHQNCPALSRIPTDMGYVGQNSGLAIRCRQLFAKATFKLDYIYNEGLPNFLAPYESTVRRTAKSLGIFGLHKYLHYRSWFQNELAGYVTTVLSDPQIQRGRFWNPGFLEHLGRAHTSGRKNHVLEINAVLTLEAIERLLFRNLAREVEPSGQGHVHTAQLTA